MQEDSGQASGPGQDVRSATGPEPEETQRIVDLLADIRKKFEAKRETSQPPAEKNEETLRDAKFSLERRRAQLHHKELIDGVSEGESRSSQIDDVVVIPLKDIHLDPGFQNTRLLDDSLHPECSSSEGERLDDLKKSMANDGQKTPVVVSMGPNKRFLLRAGFRRHKCATALRWTSLRAIVLPSWVKPEDEYWFNILENTARKSLTSFEAACAARLMRDKFGVKIEVFAQKTGFSYQHVMRLLSCIENLPDELVDQWKNGARLTIEQWHRLSCLPHQSAIHYFRLWTGLPSLTQVERLKNLRGNKKRKRAPVRWLDRMMRLYRGLQGIDAPKEQRIVYMSIVEFCMGERDNVPGIYDPMRHGEYERRNQVRDLMKLDIPEPTEMNEGEVPQLDYDLNQRSKH